MEHQNICIMPFLNESKDFVLGFECGQIWDRLDKEEELILAIVHTENASQIKLMCEHYGYEFDYDTLDESWIRIKIELIKIEQILNQNK